MAVPHFRPAVAAALITVLVTAGAVLAYDRWSEPLRDAYRAHAAGDRDRALEAFQIAETRIGRFQLGRLLFSSQYAAAVYNQLALLYRAGQYEAVVEKAAASPVGARPRLWAGLALMQLGMAEGNQDAQLVWFTRAEEELRQALETEPDDWDTKVNYEIAARVLAEMRRQPKRTTENPLMLLRPQPAQGTPPRKVG